MKSNHPNREALDALSKLHSVRQAIGALGPSLRRCKPGSKLHQERWDALTRLERQANDLADVVQHALLFPPGSLTAPVNNTDRGTS